MCVQFNIFYSILIFVPNIWESYQVGLSEGGEGTNSKMHVQFNILHSILIFLPNIWGSYQSWLLSEAGRAQILNIPKDTQKLIRLDVCKGQEQHVALDARLTVSFSAFCVKCICICIWCTAHNHSRIAIWECFLNASTKLWEFIQKVAVYFNIHGCLNNISYVAVFPASSHVSLSLHNFSGLNLNQLSLYYQILSLNIINTKISKYIS